MIVFNKKNTKKTLQVLTPTDLITRRRQGRTPRGRRTPEANRGSIAAKLR
jgi:hypothetical protein